MTQMSVEIEGSVDEVLRVLRHLGSVGRHASASAGGLTETPAGSGDDPTRPNGTQVVAESRETAPAKWTGVLAGEFLVGLEPAARRMAVQVWRAGEVGMHRSTLCQRAELTPGELRSVLMRMGHALRRFQREHGVTLSRPVAANSPLQSYFVDPEFAAVATSQMFDERMGHQLADGAGRP